MKIFFAMLVLIAPAIALSSPEPLLVEDSQTVRMTGRISLRNKPTVVNGKVSTVQVLTLSPNEFFIVRPGQKFKTSFDILSDDLPLVRKAVDTEGATLECTVVMFNQAGQPLREPMCALQSVSENPARSQRSEELAAAKGSAGYDANSSFLNLPHDAALRQQLQQCSDYKTAGNTSLGERCESETRGAFAYLMRLAKGKPLNYYHWATCNGSYFPYSYPMQARCMAAVQDICKLTPRGDLVDLPGCNRIMQGGTWVANPKAQALRF